MKKKLVVFLLAIELGIVTIAAFRFAFPPHINLNKSTISSSSSLQFNPSNPPSESLVGNVLTQSGEINWQSRDATATALVKKLTKIQQGEKIKTGQTGALTVEFKDTASVTVSGDSEIGITQTLPQNLVFNQTSGTVLFTSLGTSPLSVRVLHLLVDQTKGKMSITVNTDINKVIVNAAEGEIKLGYNDTDLNSQTLTLIQGRQAIFDDDTRTVVVTSMK